LVRAGPYCGAELLICNLDHCNPHRRHFQKNIESAFSWLTRSACSRAIECSRVDQAHAPARPFRPTTSIHGPWRRREDG
jgi:hypothetical protein